MSLVESPYFNKLLKEERSIKVSAVNIARTVLPEPVKKIAKSVIRKETVRLPSAPHKKIIAGVEACFWVENDSDFSRIVSDKADAEGPFAEDLIRTISEMDNPIFIDIGSAQGVYAILGAKAGATVTAIDPDPVSELSLRKNININPEIAGRITGLNIGLGDRRGEVTLYTDKRGIYAPSMVRTVKGLKDKVIAPIFSYDELIADDIIPAADIVKIDVEGAEGLVLRGMERTFLSDSRPKHVFIEVHKSYLKKFGTCAKDVFAYMLSLGYNIQPDRVWSRRTELHCHFISSS